jgi:hypothetical protein
MPRGYRRLLRVHRPPGLCDSCPVAGGCPGLPFGMPAHRRNPSPRPVWWVGGLPAWRAISAALSGLATLLRSPPRPGIAGRLLIGGKRPPAAPLALVWPSGIAGSANPRVGRAPDPTRSCRREHAPAGRVPGDSARTTTTGECKADAQSHAACNGQRADDAQDVRTDPHSAPPPLTVGAGWGSTVTHPGDDIDTLRTNNSSSGYARQLVSLNSAAVNSHYGISASIQRLRRRRDG